MTCEKLGYLFYSAFRFQVSAFSFHASSGRPTRTEAARREEEAKLKAAEAKRQDDLKKAHEAELAMQKAAAAAKLAKAGFTGAPALIVEEAPEFWQDLGERWDMLEQYYKPYPVCRWAQAPIEAALHLQRTHGFTHHDVTGLEI